MVFWDCYAWWLSRLHQEHTSLHHHTNIPSPSYTEARLGIVDRVRRRSALSSPRSALSSPRTSLDGAATLPHGATTLFHGAASLPIPLDGRTSLDAAASLPPSLPHGAASLPTSLSMDGVASLPPSLPMAAADAVRCDEHISPVNPVSMQDTTDGIPATCTTCTMDDDVAATCTMDDDVTVTWVPVTPSSHANNGVHIAQHSNNSMQGQPGSKKRPSSKKHPSSRKHKGGKGATKVSRALHTEETNID